MTIVGSREYLAPAGVERPVGLERYEAIAQRVAADGDRSNADLSWRVGASCRDTSPELFFPVGTTGQAVVQIDQAKQVCEQCPVQEPCLEYALLTNQDSGVWGGTSEEDRRHLRRTFISRRR